MKAEQQKQAESLYFQTSLTKTEIAQIIGISRRTLHYWVRHNHWDRIRENAEVMPLALAGNCYCILAKLQESILSPDRADKPVTLQEVNAMHRLTMTIGKLKDRATLNENLEMMTYFMEFVHSANPSMAEDLKPVVNDYIKSRASAQSMPIMAPTSVKEDPTEARLDLEDLAAWAQDSKIPNEVVDLATVDTSSQSDTPTPTNRKATDVIPGKPELSKVVSKVAPAHAPDGKHMNRAARRLAARMAA
jgi:hypothetical protein